MLEDKVVLIVDDDLTLLQLYEERIKHEGAIVVTAQDGAGAIQQAADDRPHIILLDLMMPGMNGFDALTKLKSDDVTKDIPVIVFSALSDSNSEKKALEIGAAAYMVKADVLPLDVVEKIKGIITGS